MVIRKTFLCFFAGLCVSFYAVFNAVDPVAVVFSFLFLSLVIYFLCSVADLIIGYCRIFCYRICGILLCCSTALGCGCGLFVTSSHVNPRMLIPLDTVTSVSCTLLSDPVPYGDSYYRADAVLQKANSHSGIQSQARGIVSLLLPVRQIRSGFPGGFYADRIDDSVPIVQKGAKVVCDGRFGNRRAAKEYVPFIVSVVQSVYFSKTSDAIRGNARQNLARFYYGWKDSGGLLFALLTGNRDYVPKKFAYDMKNAGCAHIMALSGMHLSLVFSVAGIIFLVTGVQIGRFLFGAAAAASFVWFAGASPSLVRALLMILCALFCRFFCIRFSVAVTLIIAFCVHVLLFPLHVSQLPFLLSYASLAGLLFMGKPVCILLNYVIPSRLGEALGSSIGAMIGTVFFSIAYFGAVYPIGIAASVVIGGIVGFIMTAGIVATAVVFVCPLLYGIVGSFFTVLYTLIDRCASFFGSFSPIHIAPENAGIVTAACFVVSIGIIIVAQYADQRSAVQNEYAGL